jgi:xylose isomerase
VDNPTLQSLSAKFTPDSLAKLQKMKFNRPEMGKRGLPYERLDQLTMELLMGVR